MQWTGVPDITVCRLANLPTLFSVQVPFPVTHVKYGHVLHVTIQPAYVLALNHGIPACSDHNAQYTGCETAQNFEW
eukprot:3670768-Rhodomonas_salina.1